MADRPRRTRTTLLRRLLTTTTALLGVLVVAAVPISATAAGSSAFDNPFTGRTVDGTGTVTTPTSPGGGNSACLTASGNTSTGPLLSCSGTTDAEGHGALRFTDASTDQLGAVFGSTSFSTTHGLDISFDSYQHGGNGADGIGFVLAADDPDSPAPPPRTGPGGGSLGYAPSGGTPGLAAGYLGVGLDVYGNYSLGSISGDGCGDAATFSDRVPGAVVVRGPGTGTRGYCGLTTTYDGTPASQLTLHADDRASSLVPVRVLVNPTGSTLTTSDGTDVPAGSYRVRVTDVGGTTRTLTGDLPAVPAGLYPSDDWLDGDGVPKQLSFGWFGSTGGLDDVHEITAAQVRTLDPPTDGGPGVPVRPIATAGLRQATLTWQVPDDHGATITGYVITPYLSGVAQAPLTVDAATTTRVVRGLVPDRSYAFTVAAVDSQGTSEASPGSRAVRPYAELGAPTITAVRPGGASAVLSWTPPSSTGGSPITGYVVTPYLGEDAQTPQTFTGTSTTQTVTGLTPGRTYTFRVAAQNSSGTTPLYRINAGGPTVPATDGGPDWAADPDDSPYRRGGNTAGFRPSATFDDTVPPATPAALMDDERWDVMTWRFPVDAGTPVTVRLYFAERAYPHDEGGRVFDVDLDGARVLDHFSPYAGAGGGDVATVRELTTTSDGSVDLDFGRVAENPKVDALEVVRTGAPTTGPSSAASDAVTPDEPLSLDLPAPTAARVGETYRAQPTATGGTPPYAWSVTDGDLPGGLDLDPATGLISGTPTTAGTSTLTLTVADAVGRSVSRTLSIVVAAPATLTLSDVTPSFTLAGLPGSTVEQDGAVDLTVVTDSPGGYTVTVAAGTGTLTASTPGNADAIAVERLSVREGGADRFTRLSTDPVLVRTSSGPSTPTGDGISNDYRVEIPDVASDVYSTTLEYVATAQ